MKNLLTSFAILLGLCAFAQAAPEKQKVTATGEVVCAHCDLGVGDACNTGLKTDDVVYILLGEKVEPFLDENDAEKVTVTGEVTPREDHKVMMVEKIEAAS